MDEVIKHLGNIYAMDRPTLAVLCVLCVVAAYVIRDYMANPTMVIFVYPVLFLVSVVIQYSFILGEFYQPKKLDQWLMWTIMAAIVGNIIAITLVAWFGRFREGVRATRTFKPIASPQSRR